MLAAAVLLQASIAAPTFAPPLDTPLRVLVERSDSGPVSRHFTMERLVRFSRSGDGYVAKVLVLRAESSGAEAMSGMIDAGFSALRGTPIVFRLDASGALVSIDELAAVWERLCHGIGEVAANRRSLAADERKRLASRIAAPIGALPAEQQRALLGSLVTALIASEPAAPGVAPVKLPGASPFGRPATLEGTRRTRIAGALIEAVTLASADVSLPAERETPARSGSLALETIRSADPRTGLVASNVETLRTTTGTGSDARETLRVTRLSVQSAPPGAWPAGR